MVFNIILVQFTAIRARVSVITCCAHFEKVALQYWLPLMLPLVGLVCIKSDKSDPIFNSRSLDSKNYEEKRASNHYTENRRGSALRWLVEHSDWTWAKATSDWTLVPDRWKRTREIVPSWITWTIGPLMVTWLFRTAQFGHQLYQILTRRLLGGWGVFCPKGRYDLVSLIISIYFIYYFTIQLENLSF